MVACLSLSFLPLDRLEGRVRVAAFWSVRGPLFSPSMHSRILKKEVNCALFFDVLIPNFSPPPLSRSHFLLPQSRDEMRVRNVGGMESSAGRPASQPDPLTAMAGPTSSLWAPNRMRLYFCLKTFPGGGAIGKKELFLVTASIYPGATPTHAMPCLTGCAKFEMRKDWILCGYIFG